MTEEIFEREGGSMRGEDDFFSVARTIPLVAVEHQCIRISKTELPRWVGGTEHVGDTFDSDGSDTLVDGVQGIFWTW